ncbi:MAG: hypothetical protein ACRDPA_01860, partial [Solirubrobacteraceae bacterium]
TSPLLFGSGKSDTPWERMHWEKASAPLACAAAAAVLDLVEEPPPPQPPMSSAMHVVAMMVHLFIKLSSAMGSWPALRAV